MHKMRIQSDTKVTWRKVVLKDKGMDADFAKKISPAFFRIHLISYNGISKIKN